MRPEIPIRRLSGAALVVLLMWAGAAFPEEDDPVAWLDRMSEAVENLSYEGTLVHVIGQESSRLRIVHGVSDGRIAEKLTADGSGREIIRIGDEVMCVLPESRTILLESRDEGDSRQSPLRGRLPSRAAVRSAHYHVAFVGSEAVAGREARIVAIRPRDIYRYGYRVSLDRHTAMPLKTQLLDPGGGIPEQVLFSEFVLREHIPPETLQPSVAIDGFVHRRAGARPPSGREGLGGGWRATDLPVGFVLQARVERGLGGGLQHLVYGDGLATVSLFIEPAVPASGQVEGLSQLGAAHAYTVVHDGYMFTAIGEVPSRTVRRLVDSVRSTLVPRAVEDSAGRAPR